MSFQQIIILGRAGQDATIKYTRDGVAVSEVSVAVSKQFGKGDNRKESTTWMKVVAWRALAEVLALTKKGTRVLVIGEVSSEGWLDKTTSEVRTKIVITAHTFRFASSKNEGDPDPAGTTARHGSNAPTTDTYQDSDDIPF